MVVVFGGPTALVRQYADAGVGFGDAGRLQMSMDVRKTQTACNHSCTLSALPAVMAVGAWMSAVVVVAVGADVGDGGGWRTWMSAAVVVLIPR